MNRRLNWANGATALNMRSLQRSVANWHPAFSPLCSGRFVQSPFIKPAQGRGEFSGLSPPLVLCRQLRQGLVQLLRSALCLEFREEREREDRHPGLLPRKNRSPKKKKQIWVCPTYKSAEKKKWLSCFQKKKKNLACFTTETSGCVRAS